MEGLAPLMRSKTKYFPQSLWASVQGGKIPLEKNNNARQTDWKLKVFFCVADVHNSQAAGCKTTG